MILSQGIIARAFKGFGEVKNKLVLSAETRVPKRLFTMAPKLRLGKVRLGKSIRL